MRDRVLVVYATCLGSTVEVAATIGRRLSEDGRAVDVKPIAESPSLGGYAAAVIGSAVHHGQWLPEAVDFVGANRDALALLPVALFCVHIQNLADDETSRRNRLAYLDRVRPLVQPVAEGFFAGRFDRRGARLLLPKVVAWMVPTIDLRDWKKIRGWTAGLASSLVASA
jgi:menaquinone-dependent protoporphyrinogen oxidase